MRADDDLTIAGNLIAGRELPIGADDCAVCPDLAASNTLSAEPGVYIAPDSGDLRLRPGISEPAPVLPPLSWDDSGGPRP